MPSMPSRNSMRRVLRIGRSTQRSLMPGPGRNAPATSANPSGTTLFSSVALSATDDGGFTTPGPSTVGFLPLVQGPTKPVAPALKATVAHRVRWSRLWGHSNDEGAANPGDRGQAGYPNALYVGYRR